MPLSEKTKTRITDTTYIQAKDDLYPDRDASGHLVNATNLILRVSDDDVPKTSKDMSRLYKWEHGDRIYGTEAEKNPAMKAYRDDVNRSWGKEDLYKRNMIYIDTFKPIGEQLKRFR